MLKRWICLLLLIAVMSAAPVRAAGPKVVVGGDTLSGGIVRGGVTYVPLRGLLDALGGWSLAWDGQAATAVSSWLELEVPIGQNYILVNGNHYPCAPAFLQKGRTYVPLRAVAVLCGARVNWRSWSEPVEVIPGGGEIRQDELYWLSRIISAESRGESLLGQLAVGAVVLNRVENANYPNTIYSVIFEYDNGYQFQPVENGSIYEEPTELSILAARLCLNGTRVLEKCLYFFNPTYSQGTWIVANRTYYTTIGCHRFYI